MTVQKAVKKAQAGFENLLIKGYVRFKEMKEKCIKMY